MFSFEWQAVLGDRPLSAAELASLERAAALKRPLVRLRGQWSLVDGAAVAGLLRLAGQQGEASGADLLRSGLGLGQLDLPPELELAGVEASGPLGTLLAGDLHQRAEAIATPEAFKGELRPYQQRGLGWLVFLGQLGLGACLADDMGLGKTAQLIASLPPDPPERALQRLGPLEVPGAPPDWQERLAEMYRQLVAEESRGQPP
jgi:non-specific serine/threonine protein kinase